MEKSAGQPVDVQMTGVQRKIISLGQLYAQTERYFPVGKCVCVPMRVCACVHACVHAWEYGGRLVGWHVRVWAGKVWVKF